jgi:uncharacterized OB-fold protein
MGQNHPGAGQGEKREKRMAKIIWSCQDCGTVLPIWKTRCPNCRRMTLSWLHVVVVAVVALPALLLILRLL